MTIMLPAKSGERGIALVITMFLMAALSALAVSLMFLSQTETASSRNYRTMSQARYGGEAAVHAAMNYLMSTSYTAPSSPFTGYDITQSPVSCVDTTGCTHVATATCDASSVSAAVNSGCVVLSSISGISSNYPDTSVKTAFAAAAVGTLATNSSGTTSNIAAGTVTFGAAAILMSMESVNVYGGGAQKVIQTWQVYGDGTVPGALPATVEVTATLEHGLTSAETFAVFATNTGCGAITMAGGEVTDSYDSSAALGGGGTPVISASGGAVGSNGNLDISGNVHVQGSLSSPRTGVGACSNGNITAETSSGHATVDGGIINLPQAKTWNDPPAPSTTPGTATLGINGSTTCLSLASYITSPATCVAIAGNITITANSATLTLPNVTLSGGARLTIAGGTSSSVNLNVNTFTMTGNSTLALSTSPTATSVTMNIAGQGVASTGTVLDFTGGSLSTGSYDPTHFQILYAGTANMKMTGNSGSAATVYAPEAQFTMSGSTSFYGSILSNTFTDTGGATVHYDRKLSSKFQSLGNYVLTSFTWKKY